jgi:hypothetical protein
MAFLTPPSNVPNWALQDQVDPVSGQNNVLVPPNQQQQFGWIRAAFPPRQWFNWLGRLTAQWIAYFKQNDSKAITTISFAPAIVAAGSSTSTTAVLPISQLSRAAVMVYVNDENNANNTSWFIGNYTGNTVSDKVPQTVYSNHLTVGAIDHTTGLMTITTDVVGAGPFKIITVAYPRLP